jgi:hypothetical protein
MTEAEINRVVQYVTASTSYDREIVANIVRTGFSELRTIAATSSRAFERETLLEYVCQWTISRTGYSEPMVREVLGSAGRWLDHLYEVLATENPELLQG